MDSYADTGGKARAGRLAGHGKHQGDPNRGAQAIIAAATANAPPVQLLIGGDALDLFRAHHLRQRARRTPGRR